jgi:hypothetical protein
MQHDDYHLIAKKSSNEAGPRGKRPPRQGEASVSCTFSAYIYVVSQPTGPCNCRKRALLYGGPTLPYMGGQRIEGEDQK